MYKKASKQKLRITTNRGNLSVEQLWDLSQADLDVLAISLEAEYEVSGRKSFLVKKSKKDADLKLRFDIVLDILNSKVDEAEKLSNASEIKRHNNHIDELIAEKQGEVLKGKSIKELEKMRK